MRGLSEAVEMKDITEIMRQLRQPFRPEDIDWLPGATTKDKSKCMAMPYGDLRAYMDALDDVCGGDWQAVYTPWGERIICNLTICGVTRSSTGEMDATSVKNAIGGTVAEAQAFKRACAMFGLGRYLYNLPSAWVEFDAQAQKISKAGLAELDSRYRAWYAKKIAQQPATTPQQPATATEQPVATTTTQDEGDATFSRDGQGQTPPVAQGEEQGSPPHQRFWGIGKSAFGPDWGNGARAWALEKWSERHTPGNVRTSAKEFSDDEKTLIGDSIEANLALLQKAWRKHKLDKQAKQSEPMKQAA